MAIDSFTSIDNKEQAIADPVWYVHLRLWHRPVPQLLFNDRIIFYAEQASVVNLHQPYRPRFLQLSCCPYDARTFEIQYYMPKDIKVVQGAGRDPKRLAQITLEQLEFLPGCKLVVNTATPQSEIDRFKAFPPQDCRCCFTYQNQQYQVKLGFEVTADQFFSYDQGVNPATGQSLWGALMGPFQFTKRQDFAPQMQLPS